MENFPDNNQQNNVENIPTDTREESTIFSQPMEHKSKKTVNKNKKRLLTVIASFLIVAILAGGTFAVVKFIPEKVDETVSQESSINKINVLDNDGADYKNITVNNINGKFDFYSESETVTADGEERTYTTWFLKDYDNELLDTDSLTGIVDALTYINASREIFKISPEDCGLVNPEISATLTHKDGGVYSVYIGKNSLDNSGCYLKLSTSDKIYLSDVSIKDTLTFNALDLASKENTPVFPLEDEQDEYLDDEGSLILFDELKVKGEGFTDEIVIKPSVDSVALSTVYVVTEPINRIAENVEVLLPLFERGLSVESVLSFNKSASELKKYGLNNPIFEISMTIEDKTLTYKFAILEDGSYATVCNDSKMIYKVASNNVEFVNLTQSEFYSSWVCLILIDKLEYLKIENGDKTHLFNIKVTEHENLSSDYEITYNGKTIVTQDFQDFYQELISLPCTDFTIEKVSGEPDFNITFGYNEKNGGGKTVIDFYKMGATRYQYTSNGVNLGKVNSASLNRIMTLCEKLISKSN